MHQQQGPVGGLADAARILCCAGAVLLIGAGVLHISAAADHTNLPVMMAGFLVIATLQAGLGALLLWRRPSRALILVGLGLTLGAVTTWFVSRTVGLPFLPGGHMEPIGFKDGVTVLFELTTVPLLALLASQEIGRVRLPSPRLGTQALGVLGAGVFTLFVPALVLGGGGHHSASQMAAAGHGHGKDGHGGRELAQAGPGHRHSGGGHGGGENHRAGGGAHHGAKGASGSAHQHAGAAHGSGGGAADGHGNHGAGHDGGGGGHNGGGQRHSGGHDHGSSGGEERGSRGHDHGGRDRSGGDGGDHRGHGEERGGHGSGEGHHESGPGASEDHGHGSGEGSGESRLAWEPGRPASNGSPGRGSAFVWHDSGDEEMNGPGHHDSGPCRPTPEQEAAAERLYRATNAEVRKYDNNPARALADGFTYVFGPTDREVHMVNTRRVEDPTVLEPKEIESFLYVMTDRGLVPVAGMYLMPEYGMHGPQPGGCLTQWHHHGGLVGRWATLGQRDNTPEMMHVWTYPGLEPYGHYDGRDTSQLWTGGKYVPSICRQAGDANSGCLP